MKVGILFSGGKDSVYATEYAMQKGWKIAYLLSVKPSRTDCYLFHFGGVEATPKIAEALGLKHIYVKCDVADPKKEAEIILSVVKENPVDALLLGGVGLQALQIRTLQHALMPKTEVFVPHAGYEHETLIEEMLKKNYDIRISQFAVEGLGLEWLGKKLDKGSFEELKARARKFGFHIGGEGGHYDTIVLDGPIFKKKVKINYKRVKETNNSGYIEIEKAFLVEKEITRERWAV